MIQNAKDKKIDCLPALPDVSGSVELFLQPMKIGIVQKAQVHGLTQETIIYVPTKAVRQAFSAQQLMIRPEAERAWRWYTLHATPDLVLKPDDIAIVQGLRMRVMEKFDYLEYGYVQYHVVEDYAPGVLP